MAPFFREAGSGPGVVCLHSNASSSGQWRALMETLSPKFRVLAADSYGAGKSPPWPADRTIWLRDEAALLEPVFKRAGERFSIVGHSYGAGIALIAALAHPERVRALVLYEPTLFSLVDAQSPRPNDVDGIREVAERGVEAIRAGDPAAAARGFIDFWMGGRVWDKMPPDRQAPIIASCLNMGGWANALLREPTPLEAFSRIDVPVLYMVGTRSPLSSRAVARVLTKVLPRVEVAELDGLGHMGPVTHPERVNEVIARFLER